MSHVIRERIGNDIDLVIEGLPPGLPTGIRGRTILSLIELGMPLASVMAAGAIGA